MSDKKLSDYLIALLIIICLNFFLPRAMPGDPLAAIYGEEALLAMTPELKRELTAQFGLNKPLPEQFLLYLLSLIRGNLGYSYHYETPVLSLLLGAAPWTMLLTGLALMISTVLGYILGLESGWRRGSKADKGLLTVLMFLSGFPDFFVGIMLLLIFGVTLGFFPLAGALTPYAGLTGWSLIKDILWHLILPLTSLIIAEISAVYLLTRTTAVTVLGESFVLAARAKGIRERRIKYRHVGKNSLLPVVTRTGIRLARMLTGVLFVEIVFAYPGIGLLIYNSIMARDYPVLQGTFFLVALAVIGCNFAVDLLYRRIDPRVS